MNEMRVETEGHGHNRLVWLTIDMEMIGVVRTAMLTIAHPQGTMAVAKCPERSMKSEELHHIRVIGTAATIRFQAHPRDHGADETNLRLPPALLEKCSSRGPRVRQLRTPTTED
jgi:hypothetical protein